MVRLFKISTILYILIAVVALSPTRSFAKGDKAPKEREEGSGFLARKVSTEASTMPLFQGRGQKKFLNWMSLYLKYPPDAFVENSSGRVVASFIIEKSGRLSNIEILQSPHKSLSKEAVRVLRMSPEWTPARYNGKRVRIRMTLPILFVMEKDGHILTPISKYTPIAAPQN